MITEGVEKRGLSFSQLVHLMSTGPAKLFGLYPQKGALQPGGDADLVVVNTEELWTVRREDLYTKNKWTPFEGMELTGKVEMTVVRGKIVYQNGEFPQGPGYGKFLRRES
jgi:dihydroorotase-like cyclic amidohydrolase